jgi:hypothetical protein
VRRHDLAEAKDPDLRASQNAMRRAAAMARKIAIQTNTGIVVVRGGKPVRIPAEQLREDAGLGED